MSISFALKYFSHSMVRKFPASGDFTIPKIQTRNRNDTGTTEESITFILHRFHFHSKKLGIEILNIGYGY